MARTRTSGRLWIKIALGVAAVLVAGGAVVLVNWMRTSPAFAVTRLETGRYRYSTVSEVEGVLLQRLGRNIWTCSRDSLREDLEQLPWVRSVEITRRPPGTLAVRLQEWRPRLLMAAAGGDPDHALLADHRVLQLPAHVEAPELPIFRHGQQTPTDEDLESLLILINAVAESGLDARRNVVGITENGTGLILDLGAETGRLLVGRESFMLRLRRYLAVADDLPPASSVDLRFDGQVYVKELETAQHAE